MEAGEIESISTLILTQIMRFFVSFWTVFRTVLITFWTEKRIYLGCWRHGYAASITRY